MIQTVLTKIKEQNEILNKPLVVDQRTLSAQMGNKARAEETLKDLFIDLRNAIRNNSVVILAGGKHCEDFAKTAQDSFGCFSFDAKDVFRRLSANIDDSLITGTCTPLIFDLAMSAFADLANELGMIAYNYALFKQEDSVSLTDRESLVDAIAKPFIRDIGGELVLYDVFNTIAKQITSTEFDRNKVAIVLHSQDLSLIDSLLQDGQFATKNIFALNISKKPTETSVEKQLLEIKNKTGV